jgi:hypothetical protein
MLYDVFWRLEMFKLGGRIIGDASPFIPQACRSLSLQNPNPLRSPRPKHLLRTDRSHRRQHGAGRLGRIVVRRRVSRLALRRLLWELKQAWKDDYGLENALLPTLPADILSPNLGLHRNG